MKKILILSCFSVFYFATFAQNVDSTIRQQQLIGVWQIDNARVGDALRENFQFFPDGRFILNFSEYDDTQRVLALRGHYRFGNGLLFMTVQSRDEIIGGYFTKGSPGFQRSAFVLEGGKVQTITQIDSAGSKDPFVVTKCKVTKSGKIAGIQIDNNKYYKLSENPEAFHKVKPKHN
jgi:hypothetical protein